MNELNHLHVKATTYFNDDDLSWEEKYDLIFSDGISKRVFELVRLDYYDPDTTYEEDVKAFMHAFDDYMKEHA